MLLFCWEEEEAIEKGEKGRRGWKKGAEEEEGEERKEEEQEEEKGGMEMEWSEMKVEEKISLIQLLNELVKGGVEIGEEEEMKEVLMELEEEGNQHVEEEIEGGGEEKEGEKREWEELSEKAHQLIWVMEKMKDRREGKRSGTWKMMKKKEEEMKKKVEDALRGREEAKKKMEEEKKRADNEKRKREEAERRKKEVEERIERMEMEMGEEEGEEEGAVSNTPPPTHTPDSDQSVSSVITSLDGISVVFSQSDGIRREGNTIVHYGDCGLSGKYLNCFVGGVMTSV